MCAIACGSKTLSPAASRILDGNDLELTDCTPLQRGQGTSSESDNDAAATHAKNEAREKAAAIGATQLIDRSMPAAEAREVYRKLLADGWTREPRPVYTVREFRRFIYE